MLEVIVAKLSRTKNHSILFLILLDNINVCVEIY